MTLTADEIDATELRVGQPDEDLGVDHRETELERCDRNLNELLQEVRVAQTGVQVLFGFLLALSFTPRFRTMSGFQRIDYFVTLMASGGAAVFLIAPTAHHRILFRRGDKEHVVRLANRFTMIGLAGVAVAIVGVVLLVSDAMFPSLVAGAITAIAAVGCAITWFVMPLTRRRLLDREASGPTTPPRDAA
jgi:amino acid transporter